MFGRKAGAGYNHGMSNSRPLSNLKVYQKYHEDERLCELSFELGIDFGRKGQPLEFPPLTLRIDARDVHHVWSVGRRPDFKSNLIALSAFPHIRFHDGNKGEQKPLRVLSMLAKARKAKRLDDPTEFDIEELNTAAGLRISGWVEYAKFPEGWEWADKYRQELMDRILWQSV